MTSSNLNSKTPHISWSACALLLTLLGILLITTPHWAMPLQRMLHLSWFTGTDGMVLLGITMIGTILAGFLIPWKAILFFSNRKGFSPAAENLFCFLVLIILIYFLYQINQHVLHAFLSSADEHSCYFLAECLRRGKLFVKSHELSEFFQVVHVGNRDGKWFSVYPLGWPLLWAVGLQFKISNWLNPTLASLSLIFFFKVTKRLFNTATAWLGLFFIVISPFFLFTSASYFSHGTCLLMISIFLYSFIRWREATSDAPRVGWAMLAAATVGYGLMTRYLTMAAIAGPFLIYHYYPFLRRQKKWRRAEVVAAIIIFSFFLSIFIHNFLVTGKFYKAPNTYDKSWERLGFRDNYTPLDGLNFIVARFFYLTDWAAPGLIIVYLASLFHKRNFGAVQNCFRYAFFFIVIAYFFYFSWGGNQYGPRYYFEGFPFLCIIAAETLVYCWSKYSRVRMQKAVLGLILFIFGTSGFLFAKQAEHVATSSSQRKALYELAEKTLTEPSIVFIHGFLGDRLVLGEEDAVRNSPFLDSRILYAHDLGSKNKKLMDYFPNRKYYRGTYNRAKKAAVLEPLKPSPV